MSAATVLKLSERFGSVEPKKKNLQIEFQKRKKKKEEKDRSLINSEENCRLTY